MFYLTKIFEVPISHRLSKNLNRCFLWHGHNLSIEVTVRSNFLNENDMVIDFSELKELVNSQIDSWDHGMFINKCDKEKIKDLDCEIHSFDSDPTSEVLCRFLYFKLADVLAITYDHTIFIDSVSIWETSTSKSTYKKD